MQPSMTTLMGLGAKSFFLFAAAGLITDVMRRRSASSRHSVWALAVSGAFLLPVLSTVVPGWHFGTPATLSRIVALDGIAPSPHVFRAGETPHHAADRTVPNPLPVPLVLARARMRFQQRAHAESSNTASLPGGWTVSATHSDSRRGRPRLSKLLADARFWSRTAVAVWASGLAWMLAVHLLDVLAALRLVRRARTVTDAQWLDTWSGVIAQLDLRRSVRLVQSELMITPATFGVFRAIVIVPAATSGWTDVRRQAVLLHELAHVERWDCLTHALAEVTCAVYWFNPLAWWAKHRLAVERERACDDRAVSQLSKASSYAEELIDVAYAYRTQWQRRPRTAGYLPMTHPSQIADRVERILNRELQRAPATPRALIGSGVIAACCVASLAAVQPFEGVALDPPQPAVQHTGAVRDSLVRGTNEFHWTGALSAGDTLAISNLSGEIRVERAPTNVSEITARRSVENDRGDTVQIRLERREHKMLVCSIYSEQEANTCEPYSFKDGGGANHICLEDGERCASNARVNWVVRIPPGVRLSAITVAGDITAIGLQNDVMARSVGGRIRVATTGQVAASTVSGIDVTMGRTDWSGSLRLYAGGDLNVTLPTDAAAAVEIVSPFGRMQSDFPQLQASQRGLGVEGSGVLGTGGRTLRLATLGGRIYVRRAVGVRPLASRPVYDSSRTTLVRRTSTAVARRDARYSMRRSRRADSRDRTAADRNGRVRAETADVVTSGARSTYLPERVASAIAAMRIDEKVSRAVRAAVGGALKSKPGAPE